MSQLANTYASTWIKYCQIDSAGIKKLESLAWQLRHTKQFFTKSAPKTLQLRTAQLIVDNANFDNNKKIIKFVSLVIQQGRAYLLEKIIAKTIKMIYAISGQQFLKITLSRLDENMVQSIKATMEEKFDTKFIPHVTIDKSIINGAIISFDNYLLDLSTRKFIDDMTDGIIKS